MVVVVTVAEGILTPGRAIIIIIILVMRMRMQIRACLRAVPPGPVEEAPEAVVQTHPHLFVATAEAAAASPQ